MMDSFKKVIKDRIANPIYIHFLIFWSIFHWQVIYVTFFVSEEQILQKTSYLKHEYIQNLLFAKETWVWDTLLWLLPFVFTYWAIWKFPKLFLLHALGAEELYREERFAIKFKTEQNISKARKELLDQQTDELTSKTAKIAEEKKLEQTQEETWLSEFHQLRKEFSNFFKYLEEVYRCLYEYTGQTHYENWDDKFDLSAETFAFVDSHNLATRKNSSLTLTEKGRYFMKRYIQSKSIG